MPDVRLFLFLSVSFPYIYISSKFIFQTNSINKYNANGRESERIDRPGNTLSQHLTWLLRRVPLCPSCFYPPATCQPRLYPPCWPHHTPRPSFQHRINNTKGGCSGGITSRSGRLSGRKCCSPSVSIYVDSSLDSIQQPALHPTTITTRNRIRPRRPWM